MEQAKSLPRSFFNFQYSMATKRSPQKESGPKTGVTNSPAPAPAPKNRLSQPRKQVAEVRDSTIGGVQEGLICLRYKIEEIFKRFNTFAYASGTLDVIRATEDSHEANLVELRRQGELGSTPSPLLNRQAVNDRFPIPNYSGEGSTLPRFPKRFYTWALSHQSEDALVYSRSMLMVAKKFHRELEEEYSRRTVEQSLIVWSALTKDVEKNKTIEGIVVGAKAPSEA